MMTCEFLTIHNSHAEKNCEGCIFFGNIIIVAIIYQSDTPAKT